jgi:hypothetical protein
MTPFDPLLLDRRREVETMINEQSQHRALALAEKKKKRKIFEYTTEDVTVCEVNSSLGGQDYHNSSYRYIEDKGKHSFDMENKEESKEDFDEDTKHCDGDETQHGACVSLCCAVVEGEVDEEEPERDEEEQEENLLDEFQPKFNESSDLNSIPLKYQGGVIYIGDLRQDIREIVWPHFHAWASVCPPEIIGKIEIML